MSSLKSLGRFIYVLYFGLIGLLSFVAYGNFVIISIVVLRSKDVLFISNMVTFHKVLLLLFIFSIITWLLLRLLVYIYEYITEINQLKSLSKVFKRLSIHSIIGFISIVLYYLLGSKLGYGVTKEIIEMNILGIILFVFIIDIAKFCSLYYSKTIEIILKLLLVGVFLRNVVFLLQGTIPVEFSSIAYLVVPIVFLFKIRKLYAIASYAAIMAGVFYYLYIIINGGSTYHVIASSEVYLSMYNHGTLLLVGLVSIMNIRFDKRNIITIVPYIGFTAFWALLNRPEQIEFRLFIYELLDGDFLYMFVKDIGTMLYVIYYVVIFSLVGGSVKLFSTFNRSLA